MKILDMNWSQVEAYLRRDDRAVVPIGSTEQHAGLSLGTDVVLAERVSVGAAGALGVPLFPSLGYGYTPYFTAYPGTVCLRIETLIAVVRDVLDSLRRSGFRRILIVNGHGGNPPGGGPPSAGGGAARGVDGGPSGHLREVPQLVRRAQGICEGAGHRSGRRPCVVDGELSVDADPGCPVSGRSEADDRHPAAAAARSGAGARAGRRRQLRRALP